MALDAYTPEGFYDERYNADLGTRGGSRWTRRPTFPWPRITVTVAWGRDYNDVCPIQGMFLGGGDHKMSVAGDVVPEA